MLKYVVILHKLQLNFHIAWNSNMIHNHNHNITQNPPIIPMVGDLLKSSPSAVFIKQKKTAKRARPAAACFASWRLWKVAEMCFLYIMAGKFTEPNLELFSEL